MTGLTRVGSVLADVMAAVGAVTSYSNVSVLVEVAMALLARSITYKRCTSQQPRLVSLGFLARRERAWVLERWTNPKPQRRTRSPRYGVPSTRGESVGVA
jgi:hypothetical protein